MQTFSFDVTVSNHDLLKTGVLAMRLGGSQHAHHRIVTAATDETEASLLAAQMASAHGMVTSVALRV